MAQSRRSGNTEGSRAVCTAASYHKKQQPVGRKRIWSSKLRFSWQMHSSGTVLCLFSSTEYANLDTQKLIRQIKICNQLAITIAPKPDQL